ncbi:DIAP1 protein, partial [Amia calva]|nr:DIAP1 protein [Amia calva]
MLLPGAEELSQLAELKDQYNDLDPSEQFGVVMSSVPRLMARLHTILFKLQVQEQLDDIRPDVELVTAAIEGQRESKSFSELLELLLLIGNFMNADSNNADAFGFSLSYLGKVRALGLRVSFHGDTERSSTLGLKTTLLHFVAQTCEEKYTEMLHFIKDLELVERASKEFLQLNLKNTITSSLPSSNKHYISLTFGMHSFVTSAREEYDTLALNHKNMERQYKELGDHLIFNSETVSIEEYFGDLNKFRNMFRVSAQRQPLKLTGRYLDLTNTVRMLQPSTPLAKIIGVGLIPFVFDSAPSTMSRHKV